MTTLDVIVAGVVHSLTDDITCNVLETDGVGLPPLHRITERGPQQHGDSDQGFRLDPRIVTLLLRLSPPSMLVKRDALMAYFKPRDTAISLRWTRDDLAVRQLDCHYVAQLGLSLDAKYRYLMKVPAQFKSAGSLSDNAAFYDPVWQSVIFAIAGGADALEIPLEIPFGIGASLLDVSQPIAYPGTWRAYPLITVTGPVTSLVITNNATGEKLDWGANAIAGGAQRIVDLRYARKTVVDGSGVDKFSELTSDSNAATWHLAEDPDAPGGVNVVHVTGTGITAATAVSIQYLTRYISL